MKKIFSFVVCVMLGVGFVARAKRWRHLIRPDRYPRSPLPNPNCHD